MSLEDIFNKQKTVTEGSNEHTVSGNYGMVSSPIHEVSEIGEEVLKDGGNAIDAIIAMQFALGPAEGMNTGIGAGGFIMYYDSEKNETKVVNGHTRAPEAVKPDVFYENGELMSFDDRSMSPRSVGVPGSTKMLELAHERYGSMPLERLVDPAIKLAEEEFRVNSLWERTIDLFEHRLGDEAKKIYMPNGTKLKEGDTIRQTDYARALKAIRKEGFKSVYEGEIADAIIETLQEEGGIMTKKDLESYEAAIDNPLWGSYKEFDFAFPSPPNGGGFAVSQLLKILEPLEISQYDIKSWKKYHLLAESMRLAIADQQTYMGDPAFVDIPMEGLFNDEYLEERRKLLNFDFRREEIKGGDPYKYQKGEAGREMKQDTSEKGMETTHFTAVDRWGNIAACTTSLERMFGSGIMVPGYGFVLNNDLTDFSPEPGSANEPNGKKYAVSSKAPTIVYHDDKPFFTLGSPGASTIVGSVVQVFLHLIEYKMDLREAVAETRIFNNPDLSMEWEDGINEEAMKKLKELGYELDRSFKTQTADVRIGDVQAILIDPETGKLYGAADSPRPGAAIGLTEPPAEK
ncbi:gamma-glutamyltransferase [Salipaludibacillus sp. CUR1]|uniref:gamma-glutamyltransferase n=1 Tax=Salipaludibacillus sp. CUR1 TaxID=2820003 RepID=UPI001E33AD4F|nr:gamma-glutamyltransferase [Salipaludibacillus sp. CUR1]